MNQLDQFFMELPTIETVERNTILNKSKIEYVDWGCNPFVGCGHSCTYCLSGDTLILRSDGVNIPLKDIKIGDNIIGVTKDGTFNKYCETKVLNKWKTRKLAFKIILENGIELICSGDHRWLTSEFGWKYTIGSMQGKDRRPYLTTRNKILGIGISINNHNISDEFRKGYLAGIIRTDGSLGDYDYSGKRRNTDKQYHFRLAQIDETSVERTKQYLEYFGVQTFDFEMEYENPKSSGTLFAIRTSKRSDFNKIKELISFINSEDFYRGYIGGFFDAEGSHSNNTIRISHSKPENLSFFHQCLNFFEIPFVIEKRPSKTYEYNIVTRIKGNLPIKQKFLQLGRIAIQRKINLIGSRVKNSVRIKEIIPLNEIQEMYDITTGTGNFIANGFVSHNCYARMIDLRFNKVKNKVDWHKPKLVKNYMDLIEKKIHLVGSNEEIFLSTMTDIYAADIHNLGVARKIITRFQESDLKYRLLTKSAKIKEDAELFSNYKNGLHGLSITTNSENYKMVKKWEPRTDRISERMWALTKLHNFGNINLWVSAEPFLPNTDFETYFDEIIGQGWSSLKEIVVGKMNYEKGMDLKFDWPDCIKWIEENRKITPGIKWHYKKETSNFFEKKYPELTPVGGYV